MSGDVIDIAAYRTRSERRAHPAGSALPDSWYFEAVGYRPGLWRIGQGDVGHVVMDRGHGKVETRCYLIRPADKVTRATASQRACKSCVP